MSAALDGYRVLVIDLDARGSMTSIFGGKVADEWRPPFRCWRAITPPSARREPRPPTGARRRNAGRHALEALKVTHAIWCSQRIGNIDLIGSQLATCGPSSRFRRRMQARGWKLWDALGNADRDWAAGRL
jgi:chromosome partitioning protein